MIKNYRPLPFKPQAWIFDVDKTITDTQKNISVLTKQQLSRLVDDGETVVLCTGRAWAQCTEVVSLLRPDQQHVFQGGGSIETSQGELIWENTLNSDLVKTIVLQAVELGAEFEFVHEAKVFASPKKVEQSNNFSSGKLNLPDQLTDWSTGLLCLQWINDEVRHFVETIPHLQVKEMMSEVNGPYLDITEAGVNKGTGLARWSQLNNIELEECVGFGDSDNDLEFLQSVGWRVALGNAIPELKEIADEVIEHTDANGLGKYLEFMRV